MGSDFNNTNNFSDFSASGSSSVIAQFTPENICGEGASCIVYNLRLGGIRVAVKRLRKEYVTNPVYVASYRKEFEIGQRLKHDALPVYRYFHESFDEVYIVMDFVDGVSVEDFIKTDEGIKYFRSEENVRRFLSELLNVIAYIHRSGVIHCDLKPANIMLRHSDLAVMLLDLDKSYCDTRDLTHGGTATTSAPLSAGVKPTVMKDFEAIGNILDEIADRVPDLSTSKFKRFRRECSNGNATSESLESALRPKSNKWTWGAFGFIAVVAVLGNLLLRSNPQKAENQTVETIQSSKDTIFTIVQSEQAQPTSVPTIDFDAQMEKFNQSALKALNQLAAGELSDDEIRNLSFNLTEAYTATYHEIVVRTKEKCPEIPGIDVELTVAREAEKSQAMKLLEQVTQAVADTLLTRKQ